MYLPHSEDALVDPEKVTGYLLSSHHPDGRSRAAFFTAFGFRAEEWTVLAEALMRHAADHAVSGVVQSAYGTRYSVDGELVTPDGRNPVVRSVWIIDADSATPRLVTA